MSTFFSSIGVVAVNKSHSVTTSLRTLLTMFLVNYINRRDTDPLFPMFEILYGIELILLIFTPILSVVIINSSWSTKSYHRNVRLRTCLPICQVIITSTARIILIYHEYFGPSEYVEYPYLIVCSLVREQFLTYITALVGVMAIDRWTSTIKWKWYEGDTTSTLVFMLVQEALLVSYSWFAAALLVFDYITDWTIIGFFAVAVVVGAVLYISVFRYNNKLMDTIQKGADIGYSVAYRFQIRENLAMLRLFTKLAIPLVLATAPGFTLYPVYKLVPKGIGYDALIFFSISMYDMWMSIASIVVISYLPFVEPKMMLSIRWFPRKNSILQRVQFEKPESDVYFDQLTKDLHIPTPPRTKPIKSVKITSTSI